MLFFQRIHNPVFSVMANLISSFGEENLIILLLVTIYWCFNKKKGFITFSSLLLSLLSMQTLKAIFRAPRPFQVYPDLIEADRVKTATGYSFPSGHSTAASSFYSSIAKLYKNKAVRVLCIILIVAVPLSRLYLGVHWPVDVITGTLIGLGITLLLTNALSRLYEDRNLMKKIYLPLGIMCLIISLFIATVLHRGKADVIAFSDLMKILAVFSTASIGAVIEMSSTDFRPASGAKKRILSFITGILLIILVQLSDLLIPESLYFLWAFVRYSLIGLLATCIIPMLLIKLNLMERSE